MKKIIIILLAGLILTLVFIIAPKQTKADDTIPKKYVECFGWSACSVSCGGGTRSQKCNTSGIPGFLTWGEKTVTESCNTQPCCNDWQCSAYCGGGTKIRKCTNPDNGSTYTETSSESCNTQDCCSVFGACSVSCGGGKQYRTCKENIIVAKGTKWQFTLYNMPVTYSQDCSTQACAPIVPEADLLLPPSSPPSTPAPASASSSELPSCSFSSDPSKIPTYSRTTLSWKCDNVDSCQVQGEICSGKTGTCPVTPQITTTYTLSCSGSGGSKTFTTKVTILKIQVKEVSP